MPNRSETKPRKERTFRSGDYLNRLFSEAQEHMDALEQAEICARLKSARDLSGFTQEQMADMLDPPVTARAVANYEKSRVPTKYISQWAEITGTSKRWLLTGEEEGATSQQLAEIHALLESLSAKVDLLPKEADLKRGLETLREAIDAQASRGTGRGRKTGTVG